MRAENAPPAAMPSMLSQLGGAVRAKLRAGQKIANSFVAGSKNWTGYESHRFPGITPVEVEERVTAIGRGSRHAHDRVVVIVVQEAVVGVASGGGCRLALDERTSYVLEKVLQRCAQRV